MLSNTDLFATSFEVYELNNIEQLLITASK